MSASPPKLPEVGQRVVHRDYGKGTIIKIEERPDDPTIISVRLFEAVDGITDWRFTAIAFQNGNLSELPYSEAEAKEHFDQLKRKYQVASYKDISPLSPLYKILLELEFEEYHELSDDDIEWLKKEKVFRILAIYFETIFSKRGNEWKSVLASSNWRRANEPKRAIQVATNAFEHEQKQNPRDHRLLGAILTTRGGALRDIGNLENAEKDAWQAVELDPNKPHPYNLLGAIYYQNGQPQKGDEYFQKAIERGASIQEQDYEIRSAVQKAGETEQRIVAAYLLHKDAIKYAWAEKYLAAQ